MVALQVRARGIEDEAVLRAMERVPRHAFVPPEEAPFAYEDHPLPIGRGQTISQPYIVARMTAAIAPRPGARVLEVGTGSGYQAAVLGELGARVFTIEIVPALGRAATDRLAALGYRDVRVRIGDGFRGWPEEAPFDGILVTAAAPSVPPALLDQLKGGGKLVIPLGEADQRLVLFARVPGGFERRDLEDVRFVPMTGEARQAPR
jgi:protein-L-isoaspartate(D-aspartate) O-methyltransferase